ncbi:MAG: gp7 family phage scaffolding protein [Bacillota bacterium]|nr:gp7 family phage scaffolding protein [Bacillota bacterium]
MKPEEHTQIIHDIGANISDQAKVTQLLAQLSEDYTTVLTENKTNKETAEKLTKDNETLREANMQLFLKVGVKPDKDKEDKEDKPPEKRSFNNLFSGKGGLK